MSGYWTKKVGQTTIVINTDALSAVLEDVGRGPVDAIAAAGAAVAQASVAPSERPWIRWKPTREFPLKSRRLPSLSKMLTIPVALVVNDSKWAVQQEYGTVRKRPKRPLAKAFDAMRGRVQLAIRGKGYQ